MRVMIPMVVCSMSIAAGAAAQETPAQPTTNPVVLTVNNEPVEAAAVRLAIQNVVAQMRQQGEKQVDQQRLLQVATQQVIDGKLLAQEARRREVAIDYGKVAQILANIEKQAGGREKLEANLGRVGIPYAQLEEAVRDSEFALSLVDRDIRPKIAVSDAELESFYKDNPTMFERPEEVHARHIVIKVAEDATPEQDAAAKKKAEDARARALAGEDFAALAKELSEDATADKGGDLGFFSAGQILEPVSKVVFALQPGDISEVIKTRLGYHVIKVEERRPAAEESLDDVRDTLRNALVEQKVAGEVNTLLDGLRSKAQIVQMPQAAAPAGSAAGAAPAQGETPATGGVPPKGDSPPSGG